LNAHYTLGDLVRALVEAGIQRGDLVLTHVGLGMLGYPDGEPTETRAAELVSRAFEQVLGPEGTLVVPTYSYTYTKRDQIYDPATTPSDVGFFTNWFREQPGVERSVDPLFSVAARGPLAETLISNLPRESFGRDSIYDRLRNLNATLCNLGVGFRYATFVHHVEQMLCVPYRYPKNFTGRSRIGDEVVEQTWLYNVRPLDIENAYPDLRRLEADADVTGIIRRARVGLGEVTAVSAQATWDMAEAGIAADPWYLARGPAVPFERN
jgi:aminoglycoside 3-N-acetyltransferase